MAFTDELRPALGRLGPAFYSVQPPTPLPDPYWVARSRALACELGLDLAWLESQEALHTLTGNTLPPHARPLASVYSGHQFGQWAGQLGDGRAIYLGEYQAPSGKKWDLQLKGAGVTPYSRMGDGRAVLRSSIREFLASEAMHALGIPTTRALCVTGSDAPVRRETVETAAVVTRAAPSFIRFGHFEHFSYSGQHAELRQLANAVIDDFYPECRDSAQPFAALLAQVTQRTAELVAQWQAVGFCHGVMNTDNMSILGLTLDYGPFQFMDAFNPLHICNHTDRGGRYAYARQPNVAYWNLFCLAQAMLPLLDDPDQALQALEPYKTLFPQALQRHMGAKLGLQATRVGDAELTEQLMQMLASQRADFTLFFRRLTLWQEQAQQTNDRETPQARVVWQQLLALFKEPDALQPWLHLWQTRLQQQPPHSAAQQMLNHNPHVVLRNHLGEVAIDQTRQGNLAYLDRLQHALEHPYTALPGNDDFAELPPEWAAQIEISCSS
jgi:serine/tyrosine/threonine adenylyltransferase